MLSTWLNGWFGSWYSAWGSREIKAVSKKEKYPWLNDEQIKRLEASVDGLTWSQKSIQLQKNYQAMIQLINTQNVNDNRVAVNNERFKNSLNKSDPRACKFDQSACRQTDLVNLVKDVKHLKASTSEDRVMEGLMQEMEIRWVSMDSLNNYLDKGDEEFLYEMELAERPAEEESKIKKLAPIIWVWGWLLAWADATLYGLWAVAEKIWEKVYEFPIDSSMQEARKINQVWTRVKDAEEAVKDAKADLKVAKKTWEWVEEAEKALEKAEKNLTKAKETKVVKVADTAREYNVWEWLLEWWTAESRWIQASSKANQIFKKTIEPALEKSTAKINVQKLIEWLAEDIEEIAKKDPDKLEAYNDALKDLKKSYKAKEFANYSMKDAQTLKSWLQGRTPQKFYKGKEITNELQELKWILGSKLSKEIHTNLSKEIWENTAKLYKDYANLKEYAGNMVKQSTNAWLKAWFWNFWSTTFHKATDGASAKAWLILNKWWKAVKEATNPNNWVKAASEWLNKIKPSTWLNSFKNTLVKAWADENVVNNAMKALSKSKNVIWTVASKTLSPILEVAWEVALPLEAMWSIKFIENHADMYSIIPIMYEKYNWAHWNPSKDFKWWTEEDRANIWLSSDDIYNIITSDEFGEVDNKISWEWDRLFNQFLWLTKHHSDNVKNYDPIQILWD